MAKQITSVSIDTDVLSTARKQGINFSQVLEEALRDIIRGTLHSDTASVDYAFEKAKLERLKKKVSELQEEMETAKGRIDLYDDFVRSETERKLREEREKVDDSRKCLKCHEIIGDKIKAHKFGIGIVCNNCFFNLTKEDVKKFTTFPSYKIEEGDDIRKEETKGE